MHIRPNAIFGAVLYRFLKGAPAYFLHFKEKTETNPGC